MSFNKELLNCLKSVVLKNFEKRTEDFPSACIIGACVGIYHAKKDKYIDFIHQFEVTTAQGEISIIAALKEAEAITNKLFPTLTTAINHGIID
jgi:hypothetical protein